VVEQGRYRFAKVYRGDPWTPGAAAPLAFPGKSVDDGEFLLAVNGHGLSSADNVYAAFLGLANRPVTIRVGPRADGTNARDVTVVPITSEARLRYVDWVQRNRETVARLSGGKIAYVHLPDTGTEGLTAFDHYYFPQLDRAGMIVDDRFNRGGAEADYVIDYLSRPAAMYESVRRGQDYRAPFGVKPAATALLINERTGSGGEGLAWMFKRDRLGPVIGKRTWGGAVGLDGFGLSDGGEVTIPTHRSYAADGQWIIENQGVSPDIDVAVDPASWRVGRDPQLERAVEVLMRRVNAPANGRSGRPSATRAGAPHRHSGASGGDDR
jgi:tricorn protease